MLRLICTILLFCMMLSHGSMGEAVPHVHDDQHVHAPHAADHHDDAVDDDGDEHTLAPEATGHHVHLIVDIAHAGTMAPARIMGHTLIMRMTSDAPPGSLRTQPLLEPPSA